MAEVLSAEEINALLGSIDNDEDVFDLEKYRVYDKKIKRIHNLKKRKLNKNRYELIKFNLLKNIVKR